LTNAHLSDLLVPGNFAIVGNERFDTFSWSVTGSGGGILPDPANIKVSAILNGTDTGLFFQNGPFLTVGNQTLDAHLGFDVTALDSMKKLEQQNLPNGGQSFTSMTFAPQSTIQVSKDILLVGNAFTGTGPINVATMSDFSQIFNPPVPEPSGIVMAALGSGGIGWFGWRRKRGRKRQGQSPGAKLGRH
jgi:PEP-CTERM motif